jgi:deoxyribonuclease V
MIDLTKFKEEQIRLSKKTIIRDDSDKTIKKIAGCNTVCTSGMMIAAISVCDAKTMRLAEQKCSFSKIAFPYIPGFRSYRDAAPLIDAYHKLETEPDILLIEGCGILHPRRFGIASHIGLILDKPTVGVTKKPICGDIVGDTIYLQKEAVGKALHTKDMAKPIYVSPGHRITLKSSVEIVKASLTWHKLPEPMHLAHKYASKFKRKRMEEM